MSFSGPSVSCLVFGYGCWQIPVALLLWDSSHSQQLLSQNQLARYWRENLVSGLKGETQFSLKLPGRCTERCLCGHRSTKTEQPSASWLWQFLRVEGMPLPFGCLSSTLHYGTTTLGKFSAAVVTQSFFLFRFYLPTSWNHVLPLTPLVFYSSSLLSFPSSSLCSAAHNIALTLLAGGCPVWNHPPGPEHTWRLHGSCSIHWVDSLGTDEL